MRVALLLGTMMETPVFKFLPLVLGLMVTGSQAFATDVVTAKMVSKDGMVIDTVMLNEIPDGNSDHGDLPGLNDGDHGITLLETGDCTDEIEAADGLISCSEMSQQDY